MLLRENHTVMKVSDNCQKENIFRGNNMIEWVKKSKVVKLGVMI